MKTACKGLWQNTQGQDLVEYALVAGIVAVAAVAAMPILSGSVGTLYTRIGSMIEAKVK